MAVTAVGTPTAPVTSATSPVTGTFSGTQPRTAGHLLVAMVTATAGTSTTAISTPSGWTKQDEAVNSNTHARTASYTKTAAGGDAAPSFSSTLTGTTPQMTCELCEFTGANTGSPVDTTGDAAAAVSQTTLTITSNANVTAAGEYALTAFAMTGGTSGTITWTAGSPFTNQGVDGTTGVPHAAYDFKANPASGGTLSETGTTSVAANAWAGTMIVIAAAPAAPSGVVQPRATVPIPRRRLARAIVQRITGQPPPATPNKQPPLIPRPRPLRRAFVRLITGQPPPAKPNKQLPLLLHPRPPQRAVVRSITGTSPPVISAYRPQPPRPLVRRPARAVVLSVRPRPVPAAASAGQLVTQDYDGKSWWKKRWILRL